MENRRAGVAAVLLIAVAFAVLPCYGGIYQSTPRSMPNHDQSQLPAPQSGYYCGPVAAWNSIEWLRTSRPDLFKDSAPADWKTGVNELAGLMQTNANQGTWVSDFIKGKQDYFAAHGQAGVWSVESKSADWNPTLGQWDTAQPDWAWIKDQMDKGQDVEVIIRWNGGAHWTLPSPAKGVFDDDPFAAAVLTLAGYTWDDVNSNQLFDAGDSLLWQLSDPHQAVTSMSMDLGLSPVAPGANWITGSYAGKSVWVTAAVAESPEPGSLLLAVSGLGWALIRRKR